LHFVLIACFLPLPLLAIAWSRTNRRPIELSILTFSAVLVLTAFVRSLKLTFLGGDYSDRLYTTIGVNLFVAVGLGFYLGIKGRWFAVFAAIVLAFGWFVVWSINSVV
jgi:hypothetical protein